MNPHRSILALSIFALASLAGCQSGPATSTYEAVEVLPVSECSASCSPSGASTPEGMDPETTCFDGCNHCTCTDEGPRCDQLNACDDAG